VYRYVLIEKDNDMLLDILVLLQTISYCTGILGIGSLYYTFI